MLLRRLNAVLGKNPLRKSVVGVPPLIFALVVGVLFICHASSDLPLRCNMEGTAATQALLPYGLMVECRPNHIVIHPSTFVVTADDD